MMRWFMKSLAIIGEVVLSIVFTTFAITCTGNTPQTNPPVASSSETTVSSSVSEKSGSLPLRTLRDVALSGGASRFDYQSFDVNSGRLYIPHLGDGILTIFDANKETVIGDVKDLPRVHGVIAVPELHRIYASATGANELAVVDDNTLQIVARVPAGDYPDGVAYAPKVNKIYVSDLHGKTDTVIDAK